MSRYVINILASRDLTEIADYFAENSLEAGERFFREFNRNRYTTESSHLRALDGVPGSEFAL
jgi:hypothetical protein